MTDTTSELRQILFNVIVDAIAIGQRIDYVGLDYNGKADLIEKLQDMHQKEFEALLATQKQRWAKEIIGEDEPQKGWTKDKTSWVNMKRNLLRAEQRQRAALDGVIGEERE